MIMGQELGRAGASVAEKVLKADEDNVAIRLILLGYYGALKSRHDKYFRQLIWMINNRPGDYVCFYLGGYVSSKKGFEWTESRSRDAAARWMHQVRKNSNDARILSNAANFFQYIGDFPTMERLYKRALKIDTTFALPARRLAYNYRAKASEASGPARKVGVRRALAMVDLALERDDQFGERLGLLVEFTPTAIKFGYLEQAEKYATELRHHGRKLNLWRQYAYLYLAWLDFRLQRIRQLNNHLKKLKASFADDPTHLPSGTAALSFVNEILGANENNIGQKVLSVLIAGEENEAEKLELMEWLAAIENGTKVKHKLLKRCMFYFPP